MPEQITTQEIREVYIKADLLFAEAEIQQALNRLAFEISADLAEETPIVIPVLNGGMVIAGQLLTRLNFPLEVDYLHATRYRNTTSGQEIEWKAFPQASIQGRTILVIDDIYDEGHTLLAVIERLKTAGAKKIVTVVLLNKTHNRKYQPQYQPDYVGFAIEDRYVFGFGLDYKGYWRNAPGIFAIKEKP